MLHCALVTLLRLPKFDQSPSADARWNCTSAGLTNQLGVTGADDTRPVAIGSGMSSSVDSWMNTALRLPCVKRRLSTWSVSNVIVPAKGGRRIIAIEKVATFLS